MAADAIDNSRKAAPERHAAKRGSMPLKDRGILFVLSAPSGGGKTTLVQAILERFPDISYSVSYTTRNPRPGEREGVDYCFIDREEFQQRLNDGLWAEWAKVHDCYYGTSLPFLECEVAAGRDVLLDLDVQGTSQLLERYPSSVSVFVMPPSLAELASRLRARGTETEQEIAKRLKNAQWEIGQKEQYRHVVVNDKLPETVDALIHIIQCYRQTKTA
jgi:guanylate kinase